MTPNGRTAGARVICWCRSAVLVLACILFLPNAPALAQDTAQQVEFPAWTRTLAGTIGGHGVSVTLTRVDRRISGSYCYTPCTDTTRYQLQLDGAIDGDRYALKERDTGPSGTGAVPTGTWHMQWSATSINGTWTAPDGRTALPVTLREKHPFPFEIRVVATRLPTAGDDCGGASTISAIRLYRQGTLAQVLATDAENSCGMFLPSVIDANFDGWPDLTIAQSSLAGPQMTYQTWLFDPGARRFVDAPAPLQDIPSPEFDDRHRMVVAYSGPGCCGTGVTTYRWKAGRLEQADTATTTQFAVRHGGKMLFCYATPTYIDGRIEYPMRVERSGARLALTENDFSDCEPNMLPAPIPAPDLDIWQRDSDGRPRRVRTETVRWKRVATRAGDRYCPEIPFFVDDHVERAVLRDHPEEECSDTLP